jgi:hypothetical protein
MNDTEHEWEADGCDAGCHAAVLRAFTELRRLGECEETALSAALRVFASHHPSTPAHVASAIIEKWTRSARARVRWSICAN